MRHIQTNRNHTSRSVAAIALLALTTFAACKKTKQTTVAPTTDPNGKPAEVPVLRDGAGYTQKINMLINVTAGVNGVAGTLGVYDFSIDKSNQLNILYFTGYQSQQDYLYNTKRAIYNLSSKTEVTVPEPDKMLDNTYQQNYVRTVFEYMPYTGNVVAFNANEYRTGYYSQGSWGGYITATTMPMATSYSGSYSGGAGYYNVYTDLGTERHFMTVNPNPSSTVPLMYAHFEYKTPALAGTYLANFPEPRYQTQGTPVAITVCADSVVAYQITKYPATSGPGTYTKTGQLTPSGFTATQEYTTMRHYNITGTKMSMLVYGKTSKQYWTYTYDFTSNVLAPGLSAADLPYSGEGSDIDMDEDGNIYYTGTSGNGGGAGVSVYKRTPSGATLVGTDDFLKFGEVVKLHYVEGKVHMAVKGKVTGTTSWNQLCFLSQN